MSDIVEGDGKKLRIRSSIGLPNPDTSSSFSWRREYPAKRDFSLWKVALSLLAPDCCLFHPLGTWCFQSHQRERWFYDVNRDRLLYFQAPTYVMFSQVMLILSRYTGRLFSSLRRMDTYTHQLVPTTVFWLGTILNKIYMTGYSSVSPIFSLTCNGTISIPNDNYIQRPTLSHCESLILAARQGQ